MIININQLPLPSPNDARARARAVIVNHLSLLLVYPFYPLRHQRYRSSGRKISLSIFCALKVYRDR